MVLSVPRCISLMSSCLQSLGSHFTTTYLCPAYWSHHFHSYKFYQAKSKLNQHHWIHKSIMKILNERESFLSNYEVAEHLKDIKKKVQLDLHSARRGRTRQKEIQQEIHSMWPRLGSHYQRYTSICSEQSKCIN